MTRFLAKNAGIAAKECRSLQLRKSGWRHSRRPSVVLLHSALTSDLYSGWQIQLRRKVKKARISGPLRNPQAIMIAETHLARFAAPSQLHPVVVPQSSHTMQWPLTFMRMELQLVHWSPV